MPIACKGLLPLVAALLLGHPAAAEGRDAPRGAFCGFASGNTRQSPPGDRPPEVGAVASLSLPIVVHYAAGVAPEYAAEILGYVETAWRVEVQQMGFLAPLPDGDAGGDSRFDVYIVTTLAPGIGGYAGFSGFYEATPRQDAVAYLVIANAIDARIRRFVVAHEFFHASQMAYDWWEDVSFMEGSATWIGGHVFPDENIYWRYFQYFNAEPFHSLDFVSLANPYQYGTALFYQFLDERYGGGDGSFLRRMWEGCVQDTMENKPNYLDALTATLPPGVTIAEAYEEFGVWRLLIGSRQRFGRFRESARWDQRVDPAFEANIPADAVNAAGTSVHPLEPWSHAFLRVARPPGDRSRLDFEIVGLGATRLAVHWVALGAGPTPEEGDAGTLSGLARLSFAVPPGDGRDEVIVIVTNATDGHYDANTSPWTGSAFTYKVTASPAR